MQDSSSPTLTPDQTSTLSTLLTTFALAHGLLYLPPGHVDAKHNPPSSAIHAPLSLLPSSIPRKLFHLAQTLQGVYDVLYARIAMDRAFLDEVMGDGGTADVDEFMGELWRCWRDMRDEEGGQPLQLGLLRSDYLLHVDPTDPSAELGLKQVEFNTISSSFGALSSIVSRAHKYLYQSTSYFNLFPTPSFAPNDALRCLADGLVAAHRAYGDNSSVILFVVQDNERNVFDQRWLEYTLLEHHSILVVRQTMSQLLESASLLPDKTLLVSRKPPVTVSTIYFRATYTPTDFPTPAYYTLRTLLERSRAIKCPSLPLHLAGSKRIQQVLTLPGIVERFMPDYDKATIEALRSTWVDMWALDSTDGLKRVRRDYKNLVLKPQREGGGNNVYRDNIPIFLDRLAGKEEEGRAWIAMELIRPPPRYNYLIRSGSDGEVSRSEVVSELGIFGWVLFDGAIRERGEGGHLLRTKGKESDEGGVAVGFSVLDSVMLT